MTKLFNTLFLGTGLVSIAGISFSAFVVRVLSN
jgi:hypothetical protein